MEHDQKDEVGPHDDPQVSGALQSIIPAILGIVLAIIFICFIVWLIKYLLRKKQKSYRLYKSVSADDEVELKDSSTAPCESREGSYSSIPIMSCNSSSPEDEKDDSAPEISTETENVESSSENVEKEMEETQPEPSILKDKENEPIVVTDKEHKPSEHPNEEKPSLYPELISIDP
ncbi:uncharacterized protein LOC106463412 [Limulus polyphemus]|uniref:Uncharacterized protein LOC106463412 n=1 Tax=Limulus polyphemus TaxID=6850 RepID=A0ABM1BBX4_LIMPO|nr:uncharacterized protein LOC106463412 [Limulus polyphemus]